MLSLWNGESLTSSALRWLTARGSTTSRRHSCDSSRSAHPRRGTGSGFTCGDLPTPGACPT